MKKGGFRVVGTRVSRLQDKLGANGWRGGAILRKMLPGRRRAMRRSRTMNMPERKCRYPRCRPRLTASSPFTSQTKKQRRPHPHTPSPSAPSSSCECSSAPRSSAQAQTPSRPPASARGSTAGAWTSAPQWRAQRPGSATRPTRRRSPRRPAGGRRWRCWRWCRARWAGRPGGGGR